LIASNTSVPSACGGVNGLLLCWMVESRIQERISADFHP
jgi:hypothetical protein